jgi:lipoprotein-releasing system ATP-binding protein
MTETTTIFEVRGVTRTFKVAGQTLQILRGVDLAIDEGDFLAVQGTSGVGKTTLLHIMGLLDRPTSGEVLFRGEELGRAPDRRRGELRAIDFAFVFQFYYLLPEFNAIENVAFPSLIANGYGKEHRAPRTHKKRLERAGELLARVGLSERRHHRPHQLSGGERQRVAIARALMNQPRIVFCDEPTGNLDSRTAKGIHGLFRELNETLRQTFVVVTHEESMALAARHRVFLSDGAVISPHDPGAPGPAAGLIQAG